MARPRIFLSHASQDHEQVARLRPILEEWGVSAFIAPEGIHAGEDWQARLRSEVELCSAMLVFWTSAAADSSWVWIEVGMAAALGRPVVAFGSDHALKPPIDKNQRLSTDDDLRAWAARLASTSGLEVPESVERSHLLRRSWENLYHIPDSGWVRAIRLYGAGAAMISETRVRVHYRHEHYIPDRRCFPWYDNEVSRRVESERAKFFNGPNTRLIDFKAQPSPQHAATELDTLVLTIGPVGWYDYAGVAEYIRRHRDEIKDREIAQWIGLEALLDEQDVSDSKLPNICCTATALITTDGQVAYQRRTGAVAALPGWLTSAVAENINRLLDEVSPDDARLICNKDVPADDPRLRENVYCPVGVPHPFAAVRRGIKEELCASLLRIVEDGPFPHIQLSGLGFDLDSFQPDLQFVACVPLTGAELTNLLLNERGKDWTEGRVRLTPADFGDSGTRDLLRSEKFAPGGHAATVRAIELLREIRMENRCGHQEAMRLIGNAQ